MTFCLVVDHLIAALLRRLVALYPITGFRSTSARLGFIRAGNAEIRLIFRFCAEIIISSE